MKVLFAVGHASTSENIAKKYLELFGEKLEYKDVFYFKAILEEVKRDSSYDRIIIAENLEPIHSNVIAEIDKMLFNNIDSITDEAEDTTILFICSESRTRNDPLLRRFYNIGIYNFLVGDERQIPSLCRLIKDPRTKKDAKNYLSGTDLGDDVDDPSGSGVNEAELMSILRFFENLRTPDQYLINFENVCHQYDSDNDLSVIAAAICTQLKNGNEIFDTLSRDPRYAKYCEWKKIQQQQAAEPVEQPKKQGLFGMLKKPGGKAADASGIKNIFKKNKNPETAAGYVPNNQPQPGNVPPPQPQQNQADFYEQQRQAEMARQAALERQRQAEIEAQRQAEIAKQMEAQRQAEIAKQMEAQRQAEMEAQRQAEIAKQMEAQRQAEIAKQMEAQRQAEIAKQMEAQIQTQPTPSAPNQADIAQQQQDAILKQMEAQRKAEMERQKQEALEAQRAAEEKQRQEAERIKREEAERQRQEAERQRIEAERIKQEEAERQRQAEEQRRLEELARMEEQIKATQPTSAGVNPMPSYTPGGYTSGTDSYQPYSSGAGSYSTPSYNSSVDSYAGGTSGYTPPYSAGTDNYSSYNSGSNYNPYPSAPVGEGEYDLKYTGPILEVPSDYKKVVAFVGTNKVGTSFLANTVATLLAMKGVKTSILDMTKNRGLYWFYSDEMYKKLDQVASCMTDLSNGNASPVQVGKSRNLSLYTTIPKGREDNRKGYKHRAVIESAKRNCNLLIIDCDFTTPIEYFEQAQDIYLVQDLDIVKCRETVEFLREMKQKHVDWSKFRLLINNFVKCNITPKRIRKDALTIYNDPNYTYSEDIEEIKKFLVIPMDAANYANYVEAMERGKIAFEKFTEPLKGALEDLSTMVYGVPGKKGLFGR